MNNTDNKNNATIALQYKKKIAEIEKSILIDALAIAQEFEDKQVNQRIATALDAKLATSYGIKVYENWGASGESKTYPRVRSGYKKGYLIGNTQYYDIDIYYQGLDLPTKPDSYEFRDLEESNQINIRFSDSVADMRKAIEARMDGLAETIKACEEARTNIGTIEALAINAKEARADYDRATSKVSYIVNRFFDMTR